MEEVLHYGDLASVDMRSSFHWRKNDHSPLNDMEILAPASASTYKEAVQAGADAVYFGYGEFNARAGADNFTSSLDEVVSYCHFFGVKAFLTLNIAMKETELPEAEEIIRVAEKAGIDAFIIADLTLIPLIKRNSTAQIHASTQLGIHNSSGVIFAYKMGFDRVVLSREVGLNELRRIGFRTPVDLEFFIHGALCVSFSGACLLSSMLTGNSGNRGRCNQLCRKFYRSYLEGKEVAKGYLLSAKDLCFSDRISDIVDSCVRSGKIEGRLRRAEYISGVTSYYHNLKEGKDCDVTEDDLKVLFNRGDYTPGYFENNNVIYPFSPAHIGLTVGKVVKLLNPHTALVKTDRLLKRMNGYKLMRKDVEVSGCSATGEEKNGLSVIYCSEVIQIGDCVHLTSDIDLKNKLLAQKKRYTVSLDIVIVGGEKPYIGIYRRGLCIRHDFDFVVPKAEKHPITADDIKAQFSKTSDSVFTVYFFQVHTENAFLTKAQLNSMRREIMEILEKDLASRFKKEPSYNRNISYSSSERIKGCFAEISDADFLTDSLIRNIPNIVFSPEQFDFDLCEDFCLTVKSMGNNLVWLKPPIFISEFSIEKCKRMMSCFDGIICENVGLIEMAKSLGKYTVAGWSLNIFNKYNPLTDICNNYIVSTELNKYEIRPFRDGILYAYGYLPLMNLSFCPRRQGGITCDNCYGKMEFRDERGSYRITTTKMGKSHCRHQLRNSVLTDIGNDWQKDLYFDFTVMDETIDAVLDRYFEQGFYSPVGTNKLHLNRGVK